MYGRHKHAPELKSQSGKCLAMKAMNVGYLRVYQRSLWIWSVVDKLPVWGIMSTYVRFRLFCELCD